MQEPGNLQVVLMGMITVFICLAILIFIIMIMGKVVQSVSKPAAAVPGTNPPVKHANNTFLDKDEEKQKVLAAIITVVAAEAGIGASEIQILSVTPMRP